MSAVAKVNLMSELGLLHFKRFLQRRPDNYEQTAQDYAARLRELYKSSVRQRQRARRDQRAAPGSSVFRLALSSELKGITIERASLPHAELNDRLLLVRADDDQTVLARAVVQKISEQKISIKFERPVESCVPNGEPAGQDQGRPRLDEADGAQVPGALEEQTAGKENRRHPEATAIGTGEPQDEPNGLTEFKIRLDLGHTNESGRQLEGPHSRLVEWALHNFQRLKCSQAIYRNLLGLYDERLDSVNEKARVMSFSDLLPRPNTQQKIAIKQALKRRLTLIEGPAGTGKTLLAAHIAANVCRLRQTRVLVCSPIQSTVDRLTELLMDRVGGQLVVKLPRPEQERAGRKWRAPGSISRNRASCSGSELAPADHCHLDKLVDDEIYLQAYERSRDTLGEEHERLHAHAYRMVTSGPERRRREMEAKVLARASVVCCCIEQTGSQLLRGVEFGMLVLDDVHVTSELDCLVAMMTRGLKQVALLSDSRRLVRLARGCKTSHSGGVANGAASSPPARSPSVGASPTRDQPAPIGEAAEQQGRAQVGSLKRRGQRADGNLTRKTRHTSAKSESGQAAASAPLSQARGVSQAAACLQPTLEPGHLFERLLALGLPTVDLRVQYRCHATLSNFFIHYFYAGRLKDDSRTNDRLSSEIVSSLMVNEHNFDWLPNRRYLTFIRKLHPSSPAAELPGASQREDPESGRKSGDSPDFRAENKLDEIVSKLLVQEHIQESRIGIIYNNRRSRLKLGGARVGKIKEGTIDEFIGSERDFLILVAGRSSPSAESDRVQLGVCSELPCDFRRSDAPLNWALTRARLGLFIVAEGAGQGTTSGPSESNKPDSARAGLVDRGDCASWRELVKYYDANQLIVD